MSHEIFNYFHNIITLTRHNLFKIDYFESGQHAALAVVKIEIHWNIASRTARANILVKTLNKELRDNFQR